MESFWINRKNAKVKGEQSVMLGSVGHGLIWIQREREYLTD